VDASVTHGTHVTMSCSKQRRDNPAELVAGGAKTANALKLGMEARQNGNTTANFRAAVSQ